MNGLRMSKSTGNYILPMELVTGENTFFEKSFQPNIVRFCFLQAHYRSVLDISNDAMLASEKGYSRLMESYKLIPMLKASNSSTLDIAAWTQSCYDAMNDDFNTPILIAQLFEGARFINLVNDGKESLTAAAIQLLQNTISSFLFDVLGIRNEATSGNSNTTEKLSGVVEMLIGMRNEARANKNFALSDQIRDQLLALGIQLKDGKEGTSFSF
jgi:cysteinyl-tRNA synthetase